MPFFDSLVNELSIPNVFSLQLCGADTSSADESLPTMDGVLVYN